jgi:hypothetical protein
LEKGSQLLSIDLFTVIEIKDDVVAFVFINDYLLNKIPQEEVLDIWKENVFPFMLYSETIRVDLNLSISIKNIKSSKSI